MTEIKNEENISIIKQIIQFISTIFLAILLFCGTCIPIGFVLVTSVNQVIAICGFIIYGVAISYFWYIKFKKSDNSAEKLALLFVPLLIIISAMVFFN